ncbi:hypothetical protein Lal_00036619 [Lupinus albus]|nr:hypothetical protein Lal_00036619 [Lupinus albus]
MGSDLKDEFLKKTPISVGLFIIVILISVISLCLNSKKKSRKVIIDKKVVLDVHSLIWMLIYEFLNNGNLEQWLHGAMSHHGYRTWEARIKILLGTAKAALLTALRCVDLDYEKRPTMGQVVRMLESEEYPLRREDRRRRSILGGSPSIDLPK